MLSFQKGKSKDAIAKIIIAQTKSIYKNRFSKLIFARTSVRTNRSLIRVRSLTQCLGHHGFTARCRKYVFSRIIPSDRNTDRHRRLSMRLLNRLTAKPNLGLLLIPQSNGITFNSHCLKKRTDMLTQQERLTNQSPITCHMNTIGRLIQCSLHQSSQDTL